MKYDDASWHSGGDFPQDLTPEAGATHTGMFVAWAFLSGLAGELHVSDFPDDISKLASRSLTPGKAFLESCDGKFTGEDLNAEGNAFTMAYFQDFAKGLYLADYDAILGKGVADLYRVPDTWKNFDRLRPILDSRFAEWKTGEPFSKDATHVHATNSPGESRRLPRQFLIVFCAIAGALSPLMAWYLWPPLAFHGKQRDNEAAAVATLRHLHDLQAQFASSNPTRGFLLLSGPTRRAQGR